MIGRPIELPVVRLDTQYLPNGVPHLVVGLAWTGTRSDHIEFYYLPIMLSDFGEVFEPASTESKYARTFPALAPLESLFLKDRFNLLMSFLGNI